MCGTIYVGWVGFVRENAVNIRVDRTSPLGNPFRLVSESERDAVCDKYAEWLENAYQHDWKAREMIRHIALNVTRGVDVNLQCWCAPKRCHAAEIKNLVARLTCA